VTDFGAWTRIQHQDRTTRPQRLTRWARCISTHITAECGPISGNGLRTCDDAAGRLQAAYDGGFGCALQGCDARDV
jgi:hypothetical protein